jgi:hypothetical protein
LLLIAIAMPGAKSPDNAGIAPNRAPKGASIFRR